MTENKKAKTNRMKQFNSGYQHGRKQTLEEVLKEFKHQIIFNDSSFGWRRAFLNYKKWLEQKLKEAME